jgi:hypothetical protein
MATESRSRGRVYSRLKLEPGHPLELSDPIETAAGPEVSPLCGVMVEALRAYGKAVRDLLDGQFANVRELAPPQLRVPCHIYVLCCSDAVLVRYDAAGAEKPTMRYADTSESISKMAPMLSEHLLHMPDDPAGYVPEAEGPQVVLSKAQVVGDDLHDSDQVARFVIALYAPKTLPTGFEPPKAPARPPRLASVHCEFDVQLRGVVYPAAAAPTKSIPADSDHFVAHGVVRLPVGWQAIEVYPRLPENLWGTEYAQTWAQIDLLSAIAQRNILVSSLNALDGRGAAREKYARLLEEFSALLDGSEEPCHQFLKAHYELICPTADARWSKLRFGENVSDFVFREPHNDYQLVEIEAPHRRIFRKDGHPRHELVHAIDQISDWLRYIGDNKARVEEELGLTGISTMPRALVVIGRSASVTDANRRALAGLQADRPRLSVLTYDDLLDRARSNLEKLFGPLSIKARNLNLYFYRREEAAGER